MQYHIETLVKHLFDKDSFEQVTVQELKQFTEAYPYAAVGQYLYAKKLYDARSWNYYEQTEQASLYFHNPLWYRWLMDQKYEAAVIQQRQEEPAQQNAYRVVVQMPKGVSSATTMPQETLQEPVQETVAEEDHTASLAATETVQLTDITREPFSTVGLPPESEEVQTEEPATNLQEYLPEINTQESIQADTEAFGFVQADGTPPAEYTETVTENIVEQQQPVQEGSAADAPVYTEEHELNLHEFLPTTDAEPIQANTESFGDIQEKDTPAEYTETVTDNTGSQSGIETIADIPAAKEEAEITPEFFAEAAAEQSATMPAQEETNMANAVAIAESSMLTEEHHMAGGGELSETIEAPAEETGSHVATETTELSAAAEAAEAPVVTEPEQVQESHEVTEPVAGYQSQEDDVQPGGDLPPYQLLDNTTEIPAAEAAAIEEKPAQGSISDEPVHEGPVTIEFVHEEPVAEPAPAEPVHEEQIAEHAVHEVEPVNHEPVQEEAVTEHTEPVQHEQPAAEEPVTTEMAAHEEPVSELIAPEAEPWVQEWDTEPVRNEPVEQEPVNQEPVQEHVTEHTEPEQHEQPVVEEPVTTEIAAHEEPATEPIIPEPVAQEQEPEHVNHEPVHEEPVTEPLAQEPVAQESVTQNPEPALPEPVTPEPTIWKAEPVFTQASTEPKTAIDTEEPIFESYHTIDYFASQGIKLGQEDYKDRLGKQLKSFTEWLRSMKRIVPTEASASLDEVTHQSIQRIAEHSVEEKEVITEAMAEVWAKQGHPEKAITVYEKLSLLNPGKSTYFAGRIEQLKAL